MLKTGKDLSQGQSFHRQLLSEYNSEITLDNYVSYFELKPIAKRIERIRQELESKYRHRYTYRGGENTTSAAGDDFTGTSNILSNASHTNKGVHHPKKDYAISNMSIPVSPASYRDDSSMQLVGDSRYGSPVSPQEPVEHLTSGAIFVDPLSPLFFQTKGFTELQKTDKALAALIHDRIELQEKFFVKLRESYLKVKAYLTKLERDFLDAAAELRTFSEDHIRHKLPQHYIPALYVKLEVVLKYRGLNLLAFRKILKKFMERCAADSLELQQRVLMIDRVINSSNVSQPSLDMRGAALDLLAVYGTVFRLTYEETMLHMREYENRTGMTAQRILPNSQTFFFGDAFPHHERPGDFAVRVLAGTCSLFCEKMVTEVLQCPRYPGNSCGHFANGEISVNLSGPVRGDDVFIVQSMVGLEAQNLSNSGAFMELALLIHSVQLAAAARITAVIPYLAYTRNVASISAVAELIEAMGCQHVITVDMHSDQVEGMFSVPMESISAMYEFVRYISNVLKNEGNRFENITVVAPSGDFLGRAKEFADALMRYNDLDSARQFVSVCTAVKRVETRTNVGSLSPARSQREISALTGTSSPTSITSVPNVAAQPFTTEKAAHQQLREQQQHLAPIVVPPLDGTVTPTKPAATSDAAAAVGSLVGTHVYRDHLVSPLDMDETYSEMSPLSGTGVSSSAQFAQHQQHQGLGMHRSSSTLGLEKAIRQHEVGRQALVRPKVEETRTEYKNYALVGDVKDRLCIIVETVVDEALKISQVAKSLHEHGAERVILIATHAVMSGKAIERLVEAPIDMVVVTDSINQDDLMRNPKLARKLRVVPIAPLLARAIEKIHTENTLATLYDKS